MPRVHFVRKARKDNPVVKAGGSYYWWKLYRGPKQYSITRPRRWQLTGSSFLSTFWRLQDELPDEIDKGGAEDLVEDLNEILDECQDSLDNMPDELQESGPAGELLRERIDELEDWISEIEGIDWSSSTPGGAAELIQSTTPDL